MKKIKPTFLFAAIYLLSFGQNTINSKSGLYIIKKMKNQGFP